MAIAAFIVAAAALLVSGAAAYFAWQQAEAARTATRIAERQDLKGREPTFTGEIESVNKWYQLDLRLQEGEPLSKVTVTIVEGHGVEFTGGQDGAPGREPRASVTTVEPLLPGAMVSWRVEVSKERSSDVRLLAASQGQNGGEWETSVWVELPQRPMVRFV